MEFFFGEVLDSGAHYLEVGNDQELPVIGFHSDLCIPETNVLDDAYLPTGEFDSVTDCEGSINQDYEAGKGVL